MKLKNSFRNSGYGSEENLAGSGDGQARIALKQDVRLEETLLSLLLSNERIIFKLSDKKINKNPVVSFKYLSDLVNDVISFANKSLNIDTSALQELLRNESRQNPNVKLIHLNNNKLSFDTMINLFNGWTSHPSDRQPIFEDICLSVLNIIKYYFQLFESSFRSDLMKKQWSETNKVHIDELASSLKQIKF